MAILIFRLGFLGDTLVGLPALWAVRRHFPEVRLDYLSDEGKGAGYVSPREILPAAGLVDRYLTYRTGAATSPARLYWLLRRGRYEAAVYLPPSARASSQVRRDLRFFRLAGVTRIYGVDQPDADCAATGTGMSESESDFLLRHLARQGIVLHPGADRGLALTEEERAQAARWMEAADIPPCRRPILVAVGPGSKMPSKRWSTERFQRAVGELIAQRDAWPIVFGGAEDASIARGLLAAWGRGSTAAGGLPVRVAAGVMAECRLYLGNDTGTMHLAAAAGVPCVGLFSARDRPGRWHPRGAGHRLLRKSIACEGCRLEVCPRGNECLQMISVADAVAACKEVLDGGDLT